MNKRKRQGILLGILPSELSQIEAEWTRVKPALDEWRWRLDDSLPGQWKRIGKWLGQAERCLYSSANLAMDLNAAGDSDMDAASRQDRFAAQLADIEASQWTCTSYFFYID